MARKKKTLKPIEGILTLKNCFHCHDFYDPMAGGGFRCDFQVMFSYCDGPRWEPIQYHKACSIGDWQKCPFNYNVEELE